jgi:hypothetical protein
VEPGGPFSRKNVPLFSGHFYNVSTQQTKKMNKRPLIETQEQTPSKIRRSEVIISSTSNNNNNDDDDDDNDDNDFGTTVVSQG